MLIWDNRRQFGYRPIQNVSISMRRCSAGAGGGVHSCLSAEDCVSPRAGAPWCRCLHCPVCAALRYILFDYGNGSLFLEYRKSRRLSVRFSWRSDVPFTTCVFIHVFLICMTDSFWCVLVLLHISKVALFMLPGLFCKTLQIRRAPCGGYNLLFCFLLWTSVINSMIKSKQQ